MVSLLTLCLQTLEDHDSCSDHLRQAMVNSVSTAVWNVLHTYLHATLRITGIMLVQITVYILLIVFKEAISSQLICQH